MARIRITLPDSKIATVSIPVRITDINYGNHLGNDSLVSILHESRMQWLASHHFSELDAAGAGLIMSDLAVEYKSESFYGDVLVVNIYAGEISTVSFELFYEISTNRIDKQVNIAKAKTGMVCYDYKAKKVIPVPGKLKEILVN